MSTPTLKEQHSAMFHLSHLDAGAKNSSYFIRNKPHFDKIAAIHHSMVSLYDLYSGRYAYLHTEYASLLYNNKQPPEDESDVEAFYSRVHPDDLEMLYCAEMAAFRKYNHTCEENRPHFSLIMTLRMRNHVGGYCRVLRRVSEFMPGRNGTLWLVMVSMEVLEPNAQQNNMQPKLYNMQNGYVYDLCRNGTMQHYSYGLSDTEKRVLLLLGMGYCHKEVAATLFLSEHTIASHRRNICEQFGTNDIKAIYKIVKALGGFVKRK